MTTPQLEFDPTPETLTDHAGKLRLGVFCEPLRDVDIADARLSWRGLPLPGPARRFRLKEWQHFAFIHPEALVTIAVVDAKFLRTSWCQFADLATGQRWEHARKGPAANIRLARSLWDDGTHFRAAGYRVEIDNLLTRGRHVARLDVAPKGDLPGIHGTLTCLHDPEQIKPLVVSLPLGRGRAMYSHKVALPVEGTIIVAGRTIDFDRENCFAILDIHKAYYPRHTFWRWATFATRDAAGRLIALNLTRNLIADDQRFNENALWVDGVPIRLGPAAFEIDPQDPNKPWRVGTADRTVELTFRPQGHRREDLRLGVVRSVFQQCFGTFHGTARYGDEVIEIDGAVGVAEDHDSVW